VQIFLLRYDNGNFMLFRDVYWY